jgi:hypothetical protein
MNETEFIVLNLINSLSTSKLSSFLIEKNQFEEIHLQLEIIKAVLNFEKPEKENINRVYFNKFNGKRTYIEHVIIDENTIDKLLKLNYWNGDNSNYIALYISKKINNRIIKNINESIFDFFETNFSYQNFNFINGYCGIIFYSNINNDITIVEKSKPERKKVSLPRGTYTKTLISVKEWLEKKGEVSFLDLMKKFEDEIKEELEKLKEIDNLIDVEEQLKIFGQDHNTGAKRSQLLLHTVNEPNRVYFRSKVTQKFDLFCYTDNNSRLLDRKIKAFDSYDINNNDIDVYYEKGEKPIKVIDFKNRYYE